MIKINRLSPLILFVASLTACLNNKPSAPGMGGADTIFVQNDSLPPSDEELQEQKLHDIIAKCAAIYESTVADSLRDELTQYCLIDIDGDSIEELYLASADKRHRAFFTIKDSPALVCTETAKQKAKLYVGRIRLGSPEGRSGFRYTNYIFKDSRLTHTFSKVEVYGAMQQSHLDGRSMTYEECLDYQEKLPREEIATADIIWKNIP